MIDAGVTEDDYGHVDEWRTWPGYTERQRLAIEFAERYTIDHQGIDDELFARLHAHFSDAEILDLSLCLAHLARPRAIARGPAGGATHRRDGRSLSAAR